MEDEGCTLWDLNNINESYCDSVAFAGERSLQHRRDDNSPYNLITNFENRIICRSDTLNYSLCGYIKTMNGADVTIEIQYYQDFNGGYLIGEENIGTMINGDTPWTFYHKKLTLPNGTKFFNIRLNSHIPQSGEAFSWFDNVSLIRWDEYGKYDVSQQITIPNDYYFLQVKASQQLDEIVVNYSQTTFDELTVGLEGPDNRSNNFCYLEQNFPNPFNPASGPTNISFHLDKTEKVSIVIYNINGENIRILSDAVFQPGTHSIYWDGKNSAGRIVNPGIYFYQLKTENLKQVKKCFLLSY
jgi:hypothetical protein